MNELFKIILEAGEDYLKARLNHPTLTLIELEGIVVSPDYLAYKRNRLEGFAANSDLHILTRVYALDKMISTMGADDKNLPALIREYGNLIKLTSPLIEKLNKQKLESDLNEQLKGLVLCIKE